VSERVDIVGVAIKIDAEVVGPVEVVAVVGVGGVEEGCKGIDLRREETLSRLKTLSPLPREGESLPSITDVDGETMPLLFDVLRPGVPSTVLIGPEGDFSIEEVRLAMEHGYKSVTLGRSRLRTETAALVAVHMMQLKNELPLASDAIGLTT